jgi:[protein-PII] uridylyltransferase
VLSAWGMNIIKANAFSNAAGVVVDTFHFSDSFRTLELNSEERDRFLRSIAGVLGGEVELERLLQARFRSVKPEVAKVNVESRIECSNEFSPNSTVLEIVTRDRPRLLYDLSRAISDHCTNIEIALIDTEGQVVIDVFYLTHRGLKLNEDQQIALVQAVRAELGSQMGN